MLEIIIATGSYTIVAPHIARTATGRTAVEKRHTSIAGGQNHPSHAYLVIRQAGRLVGITVCVMRFDPSDKVVRSHCVVPATQVDGIGIHFSRAVRSVCP